MPDHGVPHQVADWCHARPGALRVYRVWTADLVAAGRQVHEARELAWQRLRECEFAVGLVVEYAARPHGGAAVGGTL